MALWSKITHAYVIVDVAGVETLAQCCKMLDRAEEIAEAIAAAGVTTSRGLVKEELMCRSFVVKALEKLGLMSEQIHAQAGRQPDGRNSGVTSSSLLRYEEE